MTETTTTTEPSKRLKESEWLVISALWERGETTLKELSEKFGISEAALSQGLKRRGIKRGAKAHLIAKETQAKMQEESSKLIEEIYLFKKRYLRYGEFLTTSAINLLTEAKKEGKKYGTVKNDIEAIVSATKVYKTIRNDMYHLYDLYNPDNKPDEDLSFNIGVYSEADIAAMREAQELQASMTAASNSEEEEEEDEDDEVINHGAEDDEDVD
jgi:predicted DNA binding protein